MLSNEGEINLIFYKEFFIPSFCNIFTLLIDLLLYYIFCKNKHMLTHSMLLFYNCKWVFITLES